MDLLIKEFLLGSKVNRFPPVLLDGNTVAWYDYTQADTITKDGSNLVSRWNDRLLSGRDLIQANGTNQPLLTADGVLFDGVDNFMKTAGFTYNRPEKIYLVIKQVTWTDTDAIMDGDTNSSGRTFQSAVSPNINVNVGSGAGSTLNTEFVLNTKSILRILYPSSGNILTQINAGSLVNHGVGATSNMGGITIAKFGGAAASYGNIELSEAIFRKVADNSTDETAIYNYLKTKYSL
jgi:hypothetical protein